MDPRCSVLGKRFVGSVVDTNDLGGLVGTHFGPRIITASYWNKETSGQSQGVGFNEGSTVAVTGLTSAQMTQQASFPGFSFPEPPTASGWLILDGVTNPYLGWQDNDNDGIPAFADLDDDNDAPVQVGLPIWLLYEAAK